MAKRGVKRRGTALPPDLSQVSATKTTNGADNSTSAVVEATDQTLKVSVFYDMCNINIDLY